MFSIIFSKKSVKEFKNLSLELQQRIKTKLRETNENPFHYFERLKFRNDYRLRVGDYRIIADISENTISVTKIGHRKNIYNQ